MNTTDREALRQLSEKLTNREIDPIASLMDLRNIIRSCVREQRGMVLAYADELLTNAVFRLSEDRKDEQSQSLISYLKEQNLRQNEALNESSDRIAGLVQDIADRDLAIKSLNKQCDQLAYKLDQAEAERDRLASDYDRELRLGNGYRKICTLLTNQLAVEIGGVE